MASLKIHDSAGSRLLAAPSSTARKRDGRLFCSTEACPLAETLAGSASISTAVAAHEKVEVLLLNLRGPDSLQDVQLFLFNLFVDPDIIRLPRLFCFLQPPLAQLISVARAPKSREGYASIGGGSPLRKDHALKLALKEKNLYVDVYVGMRYWHPFTKEAVERFHKLYYSLLALYCQ